MTLNTYYPPPEQQMPEQDSPVRDTGDPHNIAWGYNLADLDQLARIAVARCRTRYLPADEAYETAWSAIGEALAEAETLPEPRQLLQAGWNAVNRAASRLRRWRGLDDSSEEMTRFHQYWDRPATPSPERRIVESMALWQILPTLTAMQRQAICALAATGSTAGVAAALGKSDAQARGLVYSARRRFLAWWHEGEQPAGLWRASQPSLTSRFTKAEVEDMRARYHAGERQRAIAADLGISQGQVSALISGRIKASS